MDFHSDEDNFSQHSSLSDFEDIESELYAQVYFEENASYVSDCDKQEFEYRIENVATSPSKILLTSQRLSINELKELPIDNLSEQQVENSNILAPVNSSMNNMSKITTDSAALDMHSSDISLLQFLKQPSQPKQRAIIISSDTDSDIIDLDKTETATKSVVGEDSVEDIEMEELVKVDDNSCESINSSSSSSPSSNDVTEAIKTDLNVPLLGLRNVGSRNESILVADVLNSLEECDWKIDESDRLGIKDSSQRYYKKSRVRCINCNETGHLARECSKPRKTPVCIFCGRRGHRSFKCPDSLCFNCNHPGHSARDCKRARRNINDVCKRCKLAGHFQADCSDLWRQYHLTTKPGSLVADKKQRKGLDQAYCCNCAKRGHFVHECQYDLMEHHLQPSLPYIAKYDNLPNDDASKFSGKTALAENKTKIITISSSSSRSSTPLDHAKKRKKDAKLGAFDKFESKQLSPSSEMTKKNRLSEMKKSKSWSTSNDKSTENASCIIIDDENFEDSAADIGNITMDLKKKKQKKIKKKKANKVTMPTHSPVITTTKSASARLHEEPPFPRGKHGEQLSAEAPWFASDEPAFFSSFEDQGAEKSIVLSKKVSKNVPVSLDNDFSKSFRAFNDNSYQNVNKEQTSTPAYSKTAKFVVNSSPIYANKSVVANNQAKLTALQPNWAERQRMRFTSPSGFHGNMSNNVTMPGSAVFRTPRPAREPRMFKNKSGLF